MDFRHADDPVLLGIHVLIIITGLVDCFFGYRAFKYALAILLGLVGAGVGAWLAWNHADGSWTFALIGLVLGGILGAILATLCFNLAVVAAGALFAYVLISPWLVDLALWLQLLVLVAACGMIGLLSLLVARLAIMAATATTGAFRIIYGGWYLAGGPAILVIGQDPDAGLHVLAASQDAFIALVVLAAIGFLVQFRRERKRGREKD